MKTIITTIAFLTGMLWFFPILGICQMNDYFWVFSENNALDFRYNPPKLSYLPCYNPWQSECAVSIADDQGNPKFYLDPQLGDLIRDPKTDEVIDAYPTSKLRDALGNIISNGDSIKTNPSMAQALLLPYPGITEQYILFTMWNFDEFKSPCQLYYHIIDGKTNNRKGKVTQKNIPLFEKTFDQKMCAVRHANGIDWWIATHNQNGGKYYLFLLTNKGIDGPIIQDIGVNYQVGLGNEPWAGQMSFSPQGDKLVNFMSSKVSKIEILNFDRCSGCFSPFTEINMPENWESFGGSLSPDGNLLYTHIGKQIIQYNLSAPDVSSSLTEVGWGNAKALRISKYQIAPDGKIYIGNIWHNYLCAIKNPNVKGNGCNFRDSVIFLNNRADWGGSHPPNMPNFRLGALEPTSTWMDTVFCPSDSAIIGLPPVCGYSYEWTPGKWLSDSTAAMPKAQPRSTITYVRRAYFKQNDYTRRYDTFHMIVPAKAIPPCTVDTRPEDNNSKHLFELYPNPANESFTLRYKNKTVSQSVTVNLYDITGQKVIRRYIKDSGEYTFDITELPAGVYIVRAFSGGNTLFTEKVVIVK